MKKGDSDAQQPITLEGSAGLNRREMLKRTGAVLAGLAALGGVGVLEASAQGDDEGNRGSMNAALGKGTIDLGAVKDFGLNSVTDKTKAAGVQLSHTAQGLIALTPVCTHQGCAPRYSSSAREFFCPCHGARFSADGGVTAGPARTPLSRYALSVKNGRVLVDTNKLIQRTQVSSSDFLRL